MLATSQDAVSLQKRGLETHLMTWRALSMGPNQRPQIRSVSTASGTSNAMTYFTASPVAASIESSFSACATVRGNPSIKDGNSL